MSLASGRETTVIEEHAEPVSAFFIEKDNPGVSCLPCQASKAADPIGSGARLVAICHICTSGGQGKASRSVR
jgi:hypothetical protein